MKKTWYVLSIPLNDMHSHGPQLQEAVFALLCRWFVANAAPAGRCHRVVLRGGINVDRLGVGDMATNNSLERSAEPNLFGGTMSGSGATFTVDGRVDGRC
jgi:hypothetical protein